MADLSDSVGGRNARLNVRALFDRCLALRDRILSSERFQQRAAAFPLTRFIARKRAAELFDICAGFVYSQVLLACVQLRLFDFLLVGPRSLPEISKQTGLTSEAAKRLADAAVSLRLMERRGADRYGLGVLGAALARNPGLTAMIEHHRHLYADLADPVALLADPVALLQDRRGATETGRYWPYADAKNPAHLSADAVAEYSALMASSQPLVAGEVLESYPLSTHCKLLDVGGGEGAFLMEAGRRFPRLDLMLFDLPAVAERGKVVLRDNGFAGRSETFGGNFFTDALPRGADVISLIRVVLDHPDEKVIPLLRNIRAALGDNGVLLIAEQLSEPEAAKPMGAAYFGFYLMAMGRGRARTREEIASLLATSGFRSIDFRQGRRVLGTGIVIAKV